MTVGAIARAGGLGVMRQFIGMIADESTLNDLALSLARPAVRAAGLALAAAEASLQQAEARGRFGTPAQKAQLRYADALVAWGEVGGYDAEVDFDTASISALDLPWEKSKTRPVRTLSGGQQKRFALELLLRGVDEVLLLDEPDNFLDVPAKRWIEARLRESEKSVLYVSHDRELLAQTADRVVTVEGGTAWTHPGGFASWHEARVARYERLDELRRRWDEEHQKLQGPGDHVPAEGGLQLRHVLPAAGRGDAAAQVRGDRPAARSDRRTRTSGCGWRAAGPASGRSSASGWSWRT